MIDIREIKSMLTNRAGEIAAYLYPSGRLISGEWCVGDVDGSAGKSMRINVSGKAGVWSDFATGGSGESGDLIDLWCAAKGLSFKDALPEIKEYLGIHETAFESPVKKYIRPSKPRCRVPKADVLDYLHGRGLSDEAIEAYKISENDRTIIFPYLRDGELIFAKKRKIDLEDGKKVVMPIAANMEACLFGWQAIDDNAREITICEGEIDAPSLWMMGYPALSVPYGGGGGNKQSWVANEWERLERFETIYLCMDNDNAGREAVTELIDRLGKFRCRIVTLPKKDANECLTSGIEKDEIRQCFESAKYLSPDTLVGAEAFVDEVLNEFYPPEGFHTGIKPPWKSLADNFGFRPSEVTALQGINSHGKSQLAGHIALSSINQGGSVCIASLEMRPRKVLRRMVRQATCSENPSREYIRSVFDWMAESLFMFDVIGMAKVKEMLEAFEYARRRYGVKLFIIDNFAKCGIAEDDNSGQKDFIDKITDFANKFDCHVIVLFHPRKLESEEKMPNKMDVRGSGSLTDMVHNSLVIWRNKAKEKQVSEIQWKIENEGYDGQSELMDMERKPDAVLICDKQREGDWEGRISLAFDQKSYQYKDWKGHFDAMVEMKR